MGTHIRQAVLFTTVTIVLFGGAYPAAIWAIGRIAFPAQAEGSLIRRPDGSVAGSRLIAQAFSRPEYLHARPSAVDYNASSTGGSNYAVSNPDQVALARRRLEAAISLEHVPAGAVPSEMITASGSGMDPDLPPDAAVLQAARIAAARGVPAGRVRDLILAHVAPPTFGFIGRARVNVLELNLALDAAFGAPAAAR